MKIMTIHCKSSIKVSFSLGFFSFSFGIVFFMLADKIPLGVYFLDEWDCYSLFLRIKSTTSS